METTVKIKKTGYQVTYQEPFGGDVKLYGDCNILKEGKKLFIDCKNHIKSDDWKEGTTILLERTYNTGVGFDLIKEFIK